MRSLRLCFICTCCAAAAAAQLAPEQKQADFEHLAGLYAKNYAPYEWKRDTRNFDLLDVGPWLAKVRATKNDLEFYEVMTQYVNALDDAHSGYSVPSRFVARLHFGADVYDGKVLVDSINRMRLPATEFPFQIGYELISIDGKPVEEWMNGFGAFVSYANARSTRRLAAALLTVRPQSILARAIELGDSAVVTMRRLDGALETYHIPWAKTGLPLKQAGPVPVLGRASAVRRPGPDADYMAPLEALQWCRLPDRAILNFGGEYPVFEPPEGFVPRRHSEIFYSGTFQAGGYRIGIIRIPDYSPPDREDALQQFAAEIAYFQENTDGLIIDEMRNPGGSAGYMNALLAYLMPQRFRTVGFEVRATSYWAMVFSSGLERAKAQGAPQWITDLMSAILGEIRTANREMRGRTGPIPLDDVNIERDPARDKDGTLLAYTKPLMVLVDELSASGGDAFAATIQINRRGPLFGMRTMGAGGSVGEWDAGVYSEGYADITMSLMNRGELVAVEGYPATPYIENAGVHPDIEMDYMTEENLLTGGQPFVDGFTAAMVEHIRRSR